MLFKKKPQRKYKERNLDRMTWEGLPWRETLKYREITIDEDMDYLIDEAESELRGRKLILYVDGNK